MVEQRSRKVLKSPKSVCRVLHLMTFQRQLAVGDMATNVLYSEQLCLVASQRKYLEKQKTNYDNFKILNPKEF